MKKDELNQARKSIWGEINALSGVMIAVLAGIVILSIAAFVFMNRRPPKRTKVIDDADIFSSEELEDLESMAEELMKNHDINVVLVTTRDNPNGTDDSDCKKYAADVYKENCIRTSMQDNSGICILIDLTLDYPGGRFFWLYTYGTAFFAVDNDECTALFNEYKPELKAEQYYVAIWNILNDLQDYDYHSVGLAVTYGIVLKPHSLTALMNVWLFQKKRSREPMKKSVLKSAAERPVTK